MLRFFNLQILKFYNYNVIRFIYSLFRDSLWIGLKFDFVPECLLTSDSIVKTCSYYSSSRP